MALGYLYREFFPAIGFTVTVDDMSIVPLSLWEVIYWPQPRNSFPKFQKQIGAHALEISFITVATLHSFCTKIGLCGGVLKYASSQNTHH
jgi:hypothetical protein